MRTSKTAEEFVRYKYEKLKEKRETEDRDGMKILVMSLLDMLNGKSFDEVMENFKGIEGESEKE